ncbi:oligosaccharide flippase family protein [Bacillus sp. P14.5]|uniref:lipopolysaccharide biosynthesis protein n=1 Tax=Bacillus sp. P14.5 TaxID=1983400 RepID=UPI000DEA7E7B|nr:oligosaccharide flippase family protein [Bacillus sp. P14.5]
MLKHLKRLGADSLLYAFMNVGTKIIAFIMLPIYTRFLSDPAQYGVLDYIDRITSMLTFLIIFGTDSALAYYYFEAKDKKLKDYYVRTVMMFRLGLVALIALVIFIGGDWLSELLLEEEGKTYLLLIAMGTLFFDTILTLVLTVLRYDFYTKRVVFFTVLKMLLIALVSYLILVTVWPTVTGILAARILSVAFVAILLSKYVFKYIRPYYDKNMLIEVLKYAAPLVPASLAFWIIVNANTMFLKEFTSFEEVGIYGTAIKFATIITLVTSGVQLAWRPFSMSLKDKEDNAHIFSKIYMAILLVGTLGIMVVATIMPWVIKVLDSNYWEAYKYVALISATTFLNFYYMIISIGVFFTKKTKYISYAFGMAAIVNVIMNVILIPVFSIWGAVAAYLLSYIVAIVYIFIKSQTLFYVPVSGWKMSIQFIWVIISVIGIVYIQEQVAISDMNILYVWVFYLIGLFVVGIHKDLLSKGSKKGVN